MSKYIKVNHKAYTEDEKNSNNIMLPIASSYSQKNEFEACTIVLKYLMKYEFIHFTINPRKLSTDFRVAVELMLPKFYINKGFLYNAMLNFGFDLQYLECYEDSRRLNRHYIDKANIKFDNDLFYLADNQLCNISMKKYDKFKSMMNEINEEIKNIEPTEEKDWCQYRKDFYTKNKTNDKFGKAFKADICDKFFDNCANSPDLSKEQLLISNRISKLLNE